MIKFKLPCTNVLDGEANREHQVGIGSLWEHTFPELRQSQQSDIPERRLGLSLVLNVEVWSVHDHLPLVQAVDPRDHHP